MSFGTQYLIEIDGERNAALLGSRRRRRRRGERSGQWEKRSERNVGGRGGGFGCGEEMEVSEKSIGPFAGVAGEGAGTAKLRT